MTHTTRIETAEDLERIVDEQNAIIKEQNATIIAQGELLKGMDSRIKLVTALLDNHHDVLVRHGLAKPRGGNGLAN